VRKNTVREIWARGEAVVNGWLSIPSGFSAEVMAHQGFDSLTVDMQHGVVDYQIGVSMLQGISTTGVIPLARVAWNVAIEQMDRAGIGVRQSKRQPQSRRLARAVWTQQAEALAGLELEIDPAHHLARAIELTNSAQDEHDAYPLVWSDAP